MPIEKPGSYIPNPENKKEYENEKGRLRTAAEEAIEKAAIAEDASPFMESAAMKEEVIAEEAEQAFVKKLQEVKETIDNLEDFIQLNRGKNEIEKEIQAVLAQHPEYEAGMPPALERRKQLLEGYKKSLQIYEQDQAIPKENLEEATKKLGELEDIYNNMVMIQEKAQENLN